MTAAVTALYRYPVKGFTPERLGSAELRAGEFFPCDRLFAVEDGPSGFDPDAPAFVPKIRFTVLARMARVAKARTAYDEATGVFTVRVDGRSPEIFSLTGQDGRQAFAAWLQAFLGDEASGPLKIQSAPGHRFTDHPEGHVSVINLETVRDLGRRLGRPVDPLRFRANLYVDGWPAWSENDLVGRTLRLGQATAEVFKTITRCTATEVDPVSGDRDMPIPAALFEYYGHVLCGLYLTVTETGRVAEGDRVAPL